MLPAEKRILDHRKGRTPNGENALYGDVSRMRAAREKLIEYFDWLMAEHRAGRMEPELLRHEAEKIERRLNEIDSSLDVCAEICHDQQHPKRRVIHGVL